MLEKAPADELESFYTSRKYKLEMLHYTVLGFKLGEFQTSVQKTNFEESYLNKLVDFYGRNTKILSYFEELDQIYEDLMLDNFIETFQKGLTEKYLTTVQVSYNGLIVIF
jgi:hypothetical protein